MTDEGHSVLLRRLATLVRWRRLILINTLVVAQMFYLFNSRYMRESSLRLDSLFTNRAACMLQI